LQEVANRFNRIARGILFVGKLKFNCAREMGYFIRKWLWIRHLKIDLIEITHAVYPFSGLNSTNWRQYHLTILQVVPSFAVLGMVNN
jgi:hypothetical protein